MNETQRWMQSARLRLEAARSLHEQGLHRDSINRCFFAAYHAVLALLAREELDARSYAGGFHLLNLHFVKMGRLPRRCSRLLHRLQDHRHQADYTLMDYDAPTVARYLEYASEVVEHIASVLSES